MSSLDSAHYFQEKWDLWKAAKVFPPLTGKCDYTLAFTLGRDDFGWSYGNHQRRYTGPALDLTGATVKLKAKSMAHPPSMLEAARGEDWTYGYAEFTVTGVITDAAAGEVSFTLTDAQTDIIGDVLAQIKVTDFSGNIIVPGMLKLKFLENLFDDDE